MQYMKFRREKYKLSTLPSLEAELPVFWWYMWYLAILKRIFMNAEIATDAIPPKPFRTQFTNLKKFPLILNVELIDLMDLVVLM
jgi:hypothetical protein